MTVNTSPKCPCVHIWVNSQNGQLPGFDHYSYLPLKCSCSRTDSVSYMNALAVFVQSERLDTTLDGHTATVTCAEFSPHHIYSVVSISEDRTFKVSTITANCPGPVVFHFIHTFSSAYH